MAESNNSAYLDCARGSKSIPLAIESSQASDSFTLQESHYPLAHPHVHVGLGGLQVVVEVVAQARDESHRLLLSSAVDVLRKDDCHRAKSYPTRISPVGTCKYDSPPMLHFGRVPGLLFGHT